MKRLDFPLRPHLLKFLVVHLKLSSVQAHPAVEDFLLTHVGRFGFALTQLLRKPVKSARHEGSVDDCTARLGVNLRNFKAPYYELTQGQLSPYVVFQFNEFVEDEFRKELYWWVQQHRERGGTIKEAILTCLAFYDVSETEVPYETLRKDVQRNAGVAPAGKRAAKAKKVEKFSVNLSQKKGGLSQKSGPVSQKSGVLSRRATV